jgi:integrase
MVLKSEIETFKGFLEIEERSRHTIRQYLSTISWFEDFLQEQEKTFSKINEKTIVQFQLWLKKESLRKHFREKNNREPTKEELATYEKKAPKLSGKSIYKYLTTIKKFLEVNDVNLNWTKIPTPKFDDNFNPDILSLEQIEKIARTASKYCTFQHKTITPSDCQKCAKYREPKNDRSARQRPYPESCFYFDGEKLEIMILMAYEAALRTGELCNLQLKHLNLEKNEVYIERPLKHSQPQAIPISKQLCRKINGYLENNPTINKPTDCLFPTKTGKKYYPNNFSSHLFRPIAREAGMNVRYYTLRHSRATNLLKEGLDIGWVRRITRHRNINNVLKYIHLSSDDIRKEMEKKKLI